MARAKRISKGKEIRPTFLVFCEGETEENYVKYLRSKYRLPIEIVTKVAGNRINPQYIKNFKQDISIHEKDKTFLMYDLDVEEMFDRLNTIQGTILLSSNPSFELWYLLHFQEQTTRISTLECLKKLISHHPKYLKGKFDLTLIIKIEEGQEKAIHRAKKLQSNSNPSSQVYILVEELEKIKK